MFRHRAIFLPWPMGASVNHPDTDIYCWVRRLQKHHQKDNLRHSPKDPLQEHHLH